MMSRREKIRSRHNPMKMLSSFIICMALGRLVFVLLPKIALRFQVEPAVPQVLDMRPGPQSQEEEGYRTAKGPEQWQTYHREAIGQDTAYVAGRRGDTIPAELQVFSNELPGTGHRHFHSSADPRALVRRRHGREDGGGTEALRRGRSEWGEGTRVLVYTMDSITETVEKSKQGGAAGEIIVRQSLITALREAGVKVEVATSDLDFERRAGIMDIYSAIVVDPWTWAGKGWRIKPQLEGRQHKVFILDFFGSQEPHANLGVPVAQHLTAFPVPASQGRKFLGYRVKNFSRTEVLLGETVTKRRQGVIWGKTAASFRKLRVQRLISSLANIVELHSTIAPKKAPVEHHNIVYHGHLTPEKWHSLLRESKFIIGFGNPLSGPSAVDAVMAGCVYLNPVFVTPVERIYNSQHPFLAERVGEPYVCSFEKRNTNAALRCAQRALAKNLPPMVPDELTKEAHATRVKEIFEPVMVASQRPTSIIGFS